MKKNYKPKGLFKVPIITLYLPRPGKIRSDLVQYFPGGGVYPLHFEPKIKKFVGSSQYLHIFAGGSTTGLRLDMRQELKPDIVADAHHLPFRDGVFPAVVADPPYNDRFAKELFGTTKIKEDQWMGEAIRVCKPGGKIAIYHNYVMQPWKDKGKKVIRFSLIVVTLLRFRQFVRVLSVFTKLGHTECKITDFARTEIVA